MVCSMVYFASALWLALVWQAAFILIVKLADTKGTSNTTDIHGTQVVDGMEHSDRCN